MSLRDLTKTEKKMQNPETRGIIIGCIVGAVILLCLVAIALLSGCTIKLIPVGSVHQVELNRRIAIDSYKEGLLEGFMLKKATEEKNLQLLPQYYEEE